MGEKEHLGTRGSPHAVNPPYATNRNRVNVEYQNGTHATLSELNERGWGRKYECEVWGGSKEKYDMCFQAVEKIGTRTRGPDDQSTNRSE